MRQWYIGVKKKKYMSCQSMLQCSPGAPLQADGTSWKRGRFDRRRRRSDVLEDAGDVEGLVLINLVKAFGWSDGLWL